MPVGVKHLHLRGEAGVYPAGAGCTVACWQDFTLKNLGLNATLRPSVLLYAVARLFKAEGHLTQCRSSNGVQLY